ncbi:MAG TPA: nitroreductase family protein [Candidatus Bathyarchaeia archaeon]|nr:nitroreductase family protein [Candidatus Bathyarchaeia archaeon]
MDFSEVVAKRRSVRKFKEEPVPTNILSRILDAGRWAPSAGNSQPWRFVVVTDTDVKRRIAEVCTESSKKAWAGFSPECARYLAARGGSWDKSSMMKIPVLVVVCYEVSERIRDELVLGSVWAAVENMLLAATDEGLGSCIYTFYDMEEEERIKEALRVPEKFRVVAMVQLGYSVAQPLTPSRKTLDEIVSYQHF